MSALLAVHRPPEAPVSPPTGDPVRVCFMIDRLTRAGTETQLLALIRELDRTHVRPSLVLLDGEDALSLALEPADCPTVRLGVRKLASIGAIVPRPDRNRLKAQSPTASVARSNASAGTARPGACSCACGP